MLAGSVDQGGPKHRGVITCFDTPWYSEVLLIVQRQSQPELIISHGARICAGLTKILETVSSHDKLWFLYSFKSRFHSLVQLRAYICVIIYYVKKERRIFSGAVIPNLKGA